MDNKNDGIDFKKLENELASAVEADRKYSRENAAKFRAVEQRVGSYDEFRNIVLASNLHPLEKKDIEGVTSSQQILNPLCSAKHRGDGYVANKSNLDEPDRDRQPETVDAFVKQWRRYSKKNIERYEQVMNLNEQMIDRIFSSEPLGNLLGEIVVAFNECFHPENTPRIIASLSSLSANKRFALNFQFLSKNEQKAVDELVGKLTANVNDSDTGTLHNIKSAFRVL